MKLSDDELMELALSQPFNVDGKELYHTSNIDVDVAYISFKFRGKPRDTPLLFHNIVNQLSTKKFQLPVRSLLFTHKKDAMKPYGKNLFKVVPVGNTFRLFAYSGEDDFTDTIHGNMTDDSFLERNLTKWFDGDIDLLYYTFEVIYDAYSTASDLKSLKSIITDSLSSGKHSDNLKPILDSIIRATVKHVNAICKNYVNSVEEITDLKRIHKEEVMIYAPDGFYIINEND